MHCVVRLREYLRKSTISGFFFLIASRTESAFKKFSAGARACARRTPRACFVLACARSEHARLLKYIQHGSSSHAHAHASPHPKMDAILIARCRAARSGKARTV